jgi:hypothetical protein
VPQYFIPVRGRAPAGCRLVYHPRLLGAARVAFADTKTRASDTRAAQYLAAITGGAIPVEWDAAEAVELEAADLDQRPEADAAFADLPPAAAKARSYTTWSREFAAFLYANQALDLLRSPSLKLVSRPGEDERDFRIRLQQSAREERDEVVEKLRKKYAPKIAALQERLRKAEQAVTREKEQAREKGLQAAISIGATLLGAFTGRKVGSRSNIGRATTAMRGVSRSMNERGDIERAEDTVETLQARLKEMEAEFQAESEGLAARIDPLTEELETVTIRPKKADIAVQLVALAWAPHWEDEQGGAEPAF